MKLTNLMIAGLFALAPMAQASVLQLNLQGVYNIDGVANPGDTSQTSLDMPDAGGNFVFMTQSLATAIAGSNGQGLIDSGLYAADAYHPQMQMGYGLNPNGNNVLQLTSGRSVNLPMGGHYSAIDIAAMSGGGNSYLSLTLHYADGNVTSRMATVNDWFNDIRPTTDDYYFANGLDRIKADQSSFENANNPALFGFRFQTDVDRQLLSVDLNDAGGARLNIFGATATAADVPEPGSIALVMIGLTGLFAYRRKSS